MNISEMVTTITPEKARQLLKLNTGNFRKLDQHRVVAFANEMKSGNWVVNGDTIRLNGDRLLDGQHRLAAIVRANVPVEAIIVEGLEVDCKTIDRGKPRTIAQYLRAEGVKSATAVAACAKLCVAHEKGEWRKSSFATDLVRDSEIYAFVEANADKLAKCVTLAGRANKLLPVSSGAAILYYGSGRKDPHDVDECLWFVEGLRTGSGLNDRDPVLHLRNRLLVSNPIKKLGPYAKRMLSTIAWNKLALGEACTPQAVRFAQSGPRACKQPPAVLPALSLDS